MGGNGNKLFSISSPVNQEFHRPKDLIIYLNVIFKVFYFRGREKDRERKMNGRNSDWLPPTGIEPETQHVP